MNETKIEEAIKSISGRFMDREQAVADYKDFVNATLDELMAAEDLTKDDCKVIQKVGEELAKEKLGILSEKIDSFQCMIDIYKKNNTVE